jgi:hypothetical protein
VTTEERALPILAIAEFEPSYIIVGRGALEAAHAFRLARPSVAPPVIVCFDAEVTINARPDVRAIADLLNAFEASASTVSANAMIPDPLPLRPAYTPPTPKSARHRWRKRRSAR